MTDRTFPADGQCDGKRRHATKRDARAARSATRGVGHLRIYRCPHCYYFHLGHPVAGRTDVMLERLELLADLWHCSIIEAERRLHRELDL